MPRDLLSICFVKKPLLRSLGYINNDALFYWLVMVLIVRFCINWSAAMLAMVENELGVRKKDFLGIFEVIMNTNTIGIYNGKYQPT